MSINTIDNLESAASIRAKLNEMITIVNYYSSSQWPEGPGGGGYTPPSGGGGGSYSSLTIYDSDGASPYPVGHETIVGACAAYPGAPKTIYFTKGGANVGASIEVGDSVFSSEGGPSLQPLKWYPYQDFGMNKAFYVSAGQVSEIQFCA